jgi:glyoxylase-like metal-dependent hydrolase (beta-lactamase superfamily II)
MIEKKAPYRMLRFETGPFGENCYVIGSQTTKRAIMVDPGDEIDRVQRAIEHEGFTLEAILLTHGHIDHAVGLTDIKERTKAPVYYHELESSMVRGLAMQGLMFGLRAKNGPPPDYALKGGETLNLIELAINVLHTPGHTAGEVCFWVPALSWLISGDVLFQGSIGRTDLPGGDYATLIAPIQKKLLVLPEETVVFPGHGPKTTIGQEKRTNPFLMGLSPAP